MNTAASSAYRLVHILIGSVPIGVSRPCSVAWSKIFCIGSIASMNSIGDNGSPCLSPLLCLTGLPRSPLRRILDVVDAHSSETTSCHLCPNPNCCITSSRYSQRTLSKAFAISSLTKKHWSFTSVEVSDCPLDVLEVVPNASPFYERTLTLRYYCIQIWCKSVRHHLG